MRPLGRRMMRILARALPFPPPLLELGSFRTEGQGDAADLRGLFPGSRFVGCDRRAGPGVDLIGDMEALGIRDGGAGSLVSVDALEHVRRPWRAAEEAHRVLAEHGTAVFMTCFHFKIHAHPEDYWRFTPAGLDALFARFPVRILGSQGPAERPHTVLAILFKSPPAGNGGGGGGGARGLLERVRAALDEGCRVRVPLARRLRWGLGERLVAKGYFRGLRRAQDIRLELRAGG